MSLKLYNTLTRRKDEFVPIDAANVRMYVCGPTVYDYAHIGNARPVIVFDVLFRLLRALYGEAHVTYVRNITDVDDKINARAAERGVSIREVTEETARIFREDVAALGCLPPTVEPRATEHIAEMIAIIERLIARGVAYAADGHVLFNVPAMAGVPGAPAYGALSNRSLDEMIAGARVDVAPYKRDATDFVLWKPSAADEPGWESPWGRGRPGWHIECSAMSWKHLGEVFDIHGGGIDLVFPHHENELAQSTCAFGHSVMANVWMHNGFLQVEGEKMSKSLGNFHTIRELLETDSFGGRKWDGAELRLAMLRTHYRQPIDWTVDALEEASRTLARWRNTIRRNGAGPAEPTQEFIEALSDDLNTPKALTLLLGYGARVNQFFHGGAGADAPRDEEEALALAGNLVGCAALLGIALDVAEEEVAPELKAQVDALVARRLEARKAREWAESDRLRDEIVALGVVLMDGKDAATGQPTTTWELKR
ncbi:cysteine--tRNA ligase [Alsobacter sp. SYSU M60028]|uniref:Cysteine--tRNA ligase n=1 Tax=Alsobacter ponti TaxID=2962936 RepID=A0ABT1LG39_9HYPH|nr:cysteine--tRNA ligase [Alsobacter ponti]MCP8940063.1 cysteine--tRNA ligase [Alsobacter ponti]